MSQAIVKCLEVDQNFLVPTYLSNGEIICSGCGEVNPSDHSFFEFIGAFCRNHRAIHYRWVNKNWEFDEPDLFVSRSQNDPLIYPLPTEHGIHKFFRSTVFWRLKHDTCTVPKFIEVIWNDFENDTNVLARPTDTGYKFSNNVGMHAPFLAALYEWLLHKDQWKEMIELIKNSELVDREKKILSDAVISPTPSKIFKMIWTFNRLIPGWHFRRTLGRRSPSLLLQDEVRWTTNRFDNISQKDVLRLQKCGPEQIYWGIWPDLWPEEIQITNNLHEFGKELVRLGIEYGATLTLIEESNKKQGKRSWREIVLRMLHWPVELSIGGNNLLKGSVHRKNGFYERLYKLIDFKTVSTMDTEDINWRKYLMSRLPLDWIIKKGIGAFTLSCKFSLVTRQMLQQTLTTLQPWIDGNSEFNVSFLLIGKPPKDTIMLVESLKSRLEGTNVEIIYDKTKLAN